MGPRAGLGRCGKFLPHRNSIPGPSSPERVAISTELSRPALALIQWDLKMYVRILTRKHELKKGNGTIEKNQKKKEKRNWYSLENVMNC